MDAIMNMLKDLLPTNFDLDIFLKAACVICLGILIFGVLGRLLFGRKSVLNQSVSSAIGILFIYAVTIAVYSYGVNLKFLISPLPLVSLDGEYLTIFSFFDHDYVAICGQLLNMIILAFLVNLVNGWLPNGKKLFGWIFFRCLSVGIAMLLHALFNFLLWVWLPEGLLTWAPVILLVLMIISLAVGALKFLVGAVLSTLNPLVAVLYTFFFASAIGKQLTKAMLTTLLLSGIVLVLNYVGCSAIYIGAAALAAYLPMLIVLLVLWYLIGHLL